ncbi:Cathepsin E [Porphyridium purpureum]|uniref:Cathepsin E n=1 Tax=Porphyridium purpureum TaxID=35688 RepID=A0A5J4YM51_PORPP|nr:Cathepsin E [Porphyridium purpureum]|eukprot:POR6263..scf295_9
MSAAAHCLSQASPLASTCSLVACMRLVYFLVLLLALTGTLAGSVKVASDNAFLASEAPRELLQYGLEQVFQTPNRPQVERVAHSLRSGARIWPTGAPDTWRLFAPSGVPASDVEWTKMQQEHVKAHVNGSGSTVVLSGGISTVGYYAAVLEIGVQGRARAFRVQVDTGSSLLAVPSTLCRSCNESRVKYEPLHQVGLACSSSSVSRSDQNGPQSITLAPKEPVCLTQICDRLQCPVCGTAGECCATELHEDCAFFLRYGDGSRASGALVRDEIRFAGSPLESAVSAYFGAVTTDSDGFEHAGLEGILGLAFPPLACNPTCVTPLFDEMVRAGVVKHDRFTICLDRENGGGTLTLGEIDPRSIRSKIQWAPLMHSRAKHLLALGDLFYAVRLASTVRVARKKVRMNWRAAIVDSGTTLIVVSSPVFARLQEAIAKDACRNKVPGMCGDALKSWFQPGLCVVLPDTTIKRLLRSPPSRHRKRHRTVSSLSHPLIT